MVQCINFNILNRGSETGTVPFRTMKGTVHRLVQIHSYVPTSGKGPQIIGREESVALGGLTPPRYPLT